MDTAAFGQVLWIALVLGGMYLLFIRPQMKRQKEQQALMASLEVGDRIVTIGGVFGTIASLEGDRVGLEVAPGIIIEFARSAVARKLED
ncbi:MAG: preprotein translocase subunit YajC [Coriobacteriia bacterium]|nr:preprotein translocase subunit YajC [Coriobacteriia bacterium]MBN2822963.1 preprotein translocase subunit YajC [Coriobacteriia bacterium]